jgi:hypothetical protein
VRSLSIMHNIFFQGVVNYRICTILLHNKFPSIFYDNWHTLGTVSFLPLMDALHTIHKILVQLNEPFFLCNILTSYGFFLSCSGVGKYCLWWELYQDRNLLDISSHMSLSVPHHSSFRESTEKLHFYLLSGKPTTE